MASQRKIPFFYLNHYANNKFNQFHLREQLCLVNGIAGVSSCGIPRFIQKRFVSLYDGIDTSFFSKKNCSETLVKCDEPIVFLPARVCVGKGHLDIIKAASQLNRDGVSVHVVFAGRNDSSDFNEHLQSTIKKTS